ncbi:FAD-binding oxidoreductase [Clostridium sp.]|uniref:FAD-dependent oxidoreductase n=1 Tax=Clostridium sp. TaxID=1506 RepID=UPI001EC291A0|nr:FAD-binding oxidoreductase [Clostridium sp.]MBS5885239.1 FAD-binding oxidoreductase [Clostridium sp.]MDU7243064.1 FAD-binding oxidoreductase [Clostridium sp.]
MRSVDYSGLTGKIITKESFEYEESRLAWNRAIEKYPLVIIYCNNEEDVINAILWAKNNDIEIRVRSGAHSYEGYSTGNDVAIIDISKMNEIYIDENNGFARIGGGVRNREIYEALGSRNYAFPGGGCPTVGVAGLVLGGGWGYSSRFLGLACDSLIEVEMINYEGKKLILNEQSNSDLFWACKGSGGCNFGIITSMTIKLKEKIKMGTLIYINYPNISNEDNIKVIEVLQEVYKNLDRRMNLKTAIYNSAERGRGVKLTGLFYGNSIEAREILNPLENITSLIETKIEDMSILECNRWIQDSHPDYEKYKSTGRFVYRDYNHDEIKKLIEIIDAPAEGSVYTAISFYGAGGAIADVDKLDTAYYYRDAKFIMGIQSVWEENKYADINRKWVKSNFRSIEILTEGSFVNFPLDELDNYEKEYYGKNIKRLKEIKKQYDPYNVFNYPQVIKSVK